MTEHDLIESLVAERDRLRAELYEASIQSMSDEGERHELVDERNRMRAVVETCPRCAQRVALTPESLGAPSYADVVAERDRLRAKILHVGAERMDSMSTEFGCPDCGVHRACNEIVAERDRLRIIVRHLWGRWNDATIELYGDQGDDERARLPLTREQFRLLESTIRLVIVAEAEARDDGPEATDG